MQRSTRATAAVESLREAVTRYLTALGDPYRSITSGISCGTRTMLGDPLPHLRVRDLGNAIRNAFCSYVGRCTRTNELGAAFLGASTATGEGLEG